MNSLRDIRAVNLADFSSRKETFMLDVYSDASEFGGLSDTDLRHQKHFLQVLTKFNRVPEGFVLPTVMFSGFKHFHLFKKDFDSYNGIRIVMKPPRYPCKLGIHIKVSMGNEHELFVGSIVDTKNDSDEWTTYELPINLLQ